MLLPSFFSVLCTNTGLKETQNWKRTLDNLTTLIFGKRILHVTTAMLAGFAAASCLCVADAVANAGVADFVRPTPVYFI
nr:hypothetical protein [Tanacetum cinerariifolium]